jgi:hypothetical protein
VGCPLNLVCHDADVALRGGMRKRARISPARVLG